MELYWEVLLIALLNFRFIYPSERHLVPRWLMDELLERLHDQYDVKGPGKKVCRGRIFSPRDYAVDVEQWGFSDAVGNLEEQYVRLKTARCASPRSATSTCRRAASRLTASCSPRFRGNADVLVLCGDLTNFGKTSEAEILAEDIRACTIPVIGVLGNHDYECGQPEKVVRILHRPG